MLTLLLFSALLRCEKIWNYFHGERQYSKPGNLPPTGSSRRGDAFAAPLLFLTTTGLRVANLQSNGCWQEKHSKKMLVDSHGQFAYRGGVVGLENTQTSQLVRGKQER
jgi:hypothetical protein